MASSFLSVEGLQRALSSDPLTLWISFSSLGFFSHLSVFRYIAVEEYLYNLLCVYIAFVIAIGVAYTSITEYVLVYVLARVGLIAMAFNIGLVSSIVIYRAFYHRIHRFPGPFLARITRFYDMYLAGRKVQYNVEIEMLHDTYGDFIRIGISL